MGTANAISRVGALITSFVAQVCRSDHLCWHFPKKLVRNEFQQFCFLSAWLLTSCVLVLGVNQDISVRDPVVVLCHKSAGWRCILDAALWDVGQGSAGVQSWSGGRRADDHHNQPVKWQTGVWTRGRCHSSLFNCGLNPVSDHGWRPTGQSHYRQGVIIEGRPTSHV